jgi:hypothetical protein
VALEQAACVTSDTTAAPIMKALRAKIKSL